MNYGALADWSLWLTVLMVIFFLLFFEDSRLFFIILLFFGSLTGTFIILDNVNEMSWFAGKSIIVQFGYAIIFLIIVGAFMSLISWVSYKIGGS